MERVTHPLVGGFAAAVIKPESRKKKSPAELTSERHAAGGANINDEI
jgi:hypothetical protein